MRSLRVTVFDDPRVQGQGYITLYYQFAGYGEYADLIDKKKGDKQEKDTAKF